MLRLSAHTPFVVGMALVVVASNILVQFPVQGFVGGLALADILTWGVFTYPFAFLVTDLANRRYGAAVARAVVFAGFMIAVACSIAVPPLLFSLGLIDYSATAGRLVRIAAASGTAFLAAQLLDVTVFNRLGRLSWWLAPVFASLAGSLLDTAIFFSGAPLRRCLPLPVQTTHSRWSRRRCSACSGWRSRAGCRGRSAISR